MEPLSFNDVFTSLYSIVSSSAFFLVYLIITVLLLIILLIGLKKLKKVISISFVIIWITAIALLIIKYYKFLLSIMDNFVENMLMSIYFPSLSVFVLVLLISNILLFISLFKNIRPLFYRVIWIISGIIINFLFALIVDIVAVNNIDIYTATEVYSNKDLFVLLDTSMMVIAVNLTLTFITYVSSKFIGKTNKKTSISEQETSNSVVSEIPVQINNNDVLSNVNDSQEPIVYSNNNNNYVPYFDNNYKAQPNTVVSDNNNYNSYNNYSNSILNESKPLNPTINNNYSTTMSNGAGTYTNNNNNNYNNLNTNLNTGNNVDNLQQQEEKIEILEI